jgi:hypothetical protein
MGTNYSSAEMSSTADLLNPRLWASCAVKEARVCNFSGEELGKVDEFVIDFDIGRIAYVVVAVGGFIGIGEKLFAVPWELFSIRADDHAFFLDVENQMLLDAPGFDKSRWPDMADASWGARIHSHFARKPYWESDITEAGDYAGDAPIAKPVR